MEYLKGTMFNPLANQIIKENIIPSIKYGYNDFNNIFCPAYAYDKNNDETLFGLDIYVLKFVKHFKSENSWRMIETEDGEGIKRNSFGSSGDARPGDTIVVLGGIFGEFFYTPKGYFILKDYNGKLSIPRKKNIVNPKNYSKDKYIEWAETEGYENKDKNTIYIKEPQWINPKTLLKVEDEEDYPDYPDDYNLENYLNNFTGDFLESSDINKFISENPHVEFVKSERDQIRNKSMYFVGAFYKGECQFIRFAGFRQCSEKFAKKYNIPYLSYNLLSSIEKEIFLVAKFNNIEIDEVKILTRRRVKDYYNLPSKDCSFYPNININEEDKKPYVIRSIYEEIDKESFKESKRRTVSNKFVWAKHDNILNEETREGIMTIIDVYNYSPNCCNKRKNNYKYFDTIGGK